MEYSGEYAEKMPFLPCGETVQILQEVRVFEENEDTNGSPVNDGTYRFSLEWDDEILEIRDINGNPVEDENGDCQWVEFDAQKIYFSDVRLPIDDSQEYTLFPNEDFHFWGI